MANQNVNEQKRTKKPHSSGVPTMLVIILLVIALAMGGLAGFAIARRANPYRDQLMAANARIMELENTMTLMGFSPDDVGSDEIADWGTADADDEDDDSTDLADLAGDDSDIWDEDDLLNGTLEEGGEPVVVAEFDGGQLLSTEVIPEYNDQLTTLLLSGYSADETADTVLQSVLSYMASEKIIALKAAEMGMDKLTDEDLKAIDEEAQGIYDDQISYYGAFVAQPGMSQEEIDKAAAQEIGVTLDEIKADVKETWPVKKFYDATVKDVEVTDAEVEQHYRETLSSQKAAFTESNDDYEFAHMDGETILYNLKGYRAVRDLLIPFENDEDGSKAADLLDQNDQLDPTTDTEKIQALEAELAPLYAPLERTAQEVVKKLQDGESFDSLLHTYGKDEDMEQEPLHSQGYYICDDSFLFSTEFIEGSMILEKPGQVSAPLRSASGIHLVEYTADVPEGEVPLDSVREQMKAEALDEKREAYYEEATAAMLDAANVKYYPERLQ